MYMKVLSCLLALSLLHFGTTTALAKSEADRQSKQAAKVKQGIFKLGVGKDSRVALKLRDKTRLVGYISEAGENSFVVTHPNTGAATVVAYPDVAQVKGQNLSTGAKIAIGVGIAAAIILILLLRTYCNNEGGC
ncbi:MAG TPA: hypothetical protein VNH22_02970 [Blastocatellia bacterium]|nr:hypothetical protein [Blastocatellia bacterium]